MEWIERLNEAVRYIEEHLTDAIDLGALGRIACCSSYHFQRMFSCMAGIPLSEYIRRRRMSRAAAELQSGERTILDIALRYGYSSPTAFNRAFQSVHGFPPSKARLTGTTFQSFPPIQFLITIKGAVQMDYRIEKREAFRIVGISAPLDKEIEKNFETVPKLWQKAAVEEILPKLLGQMDGFPKGVLGVSACSEDLEDWNYYIAVSSTLPAGDFKEYTVPAAVWAVFPGEGTGVSIQELEKKIVTEWLPTSGYEYANGPDIEVYLDPNPQNTKYEVWIPVMKKA